MGLRKIRGLYILLLFALIFVGWYAGQLFFSARLATGPSDDSVTVPLIVASDCDVSRTRCRAQGESLELSLKLGPPVHSLKPFDIEVAIASGEDSAPESVEIEFLMSGMEMGINRYRLEASESGVWRGRAVLPVCVTGRRDWRAIVRVISGGSKLRGQFSFTVSG